MRSILLWAAALAGPSAAQEAKTDPPKELAEQVVKFTLHPAPLPRPALRYTLLPKIEDLRAGNSIQGFMKCFAEQNSLYYDPENFKERTRLNGLSIDQLPTGDKAKALGLSDYGGGSSRNADRAARMLRTDWQILDESRRNGWSTLLPDLQIMRSLADVLKLRTRVRIKAADFDGAIDSTQTILSLGQATGKHPCVIGVLVGVAIETIGLNCLEEMASRPDAPNLFWAYQHMPKPQFDLRHALESDRWMLEVSIGEKLDRLQPMEQAKLDAVIRFFDSLGDYEGKVDAAAHYANRIKTPATTEASRKRLADSGISMDVSAKMPPLQVALLDEYERTRAAIDDEVKLFNLPFPKYAALTKIVKDREANPIMMVGIGLERINIAVHRVERQVAMLQIVEAIRAYMADYDGELPPDLDAIKLPLPNDPFTLKPFDYTLKDGTATLRSPRFDGDAQMFRLRYDITTAK